VHVASGAPSSAHSNRAPERVAENVKRAAVSVVGLAGPESRLTSIGAGGGGGPSIVHVYDSGVGSTLPAGSMARTSKVWSPAARPL
jgi:hypothetical protein